MTEIVTTIITAATEGAKGLAGALVGAFDTLAYIGTGETLAMTNMFTTMCVFVGFSIAVALLSKVFGLIRGKLRKRA